MPPGLQLVPVQAQVPAEQVAPMSHWVAHEPHAPGSLVTSTHTPPQFMRPAGQTQAPETHDSPGLQARLQPPQLFTSVARLAQTGAARPPGLQMTWPIGQLQTPEVHVPVEGHTRPHAPQLFKSVASSAHSAG